MRSRRYGLTGLMFMVLAVVGFTLLFLADPVLAAGDITGALVGFLEGTLFPLLSAAVIALVGWAVLTVGKKYNLDILLKNQEFIERAAIQGIGMAEEYAARAIKRQSPIVTEHEKLNIAIEQVLRAAPKLSRQEAEAYIDAMLARVRGPGATGATVL